MKILRTLWLVGLFVLLFPVIAVIEIVWLIWCIGAAHQFEESTKTGIEYWFNYLKAGIEANKDFVINGL